FDQAGAEAINDGGQVIGVMEDTSLPLSHRWRTYLWTPTIPNGTAGTMIDLGTVFHRDTDLQDPHSWAYDVNNVGQVIGDSFSVAGNGAWVVTPFLYQGGTMIDVNNLVAPGSGWHIDFVRGINDNGQLVGSGNGHAIILTPPTPVPIPQGSP